MTISQMIAELARRGQMHGDIEVRTTWESVQREIEITNIYYEPSMPNVLWIDADYNSYKSPDAI